MTLKEIQHKIAESKHKEFYQSYPLEIKFNHVNYSLSLTGIASIYGFVLDQLEKFEKYKALPREIIRTKDMLKKVRDSIAQLITRDEDYRNYWNDNLSELRNGQPQIFLPDFPETEFLIKVNEENTKNFPGAYEYLSGNMNHYSDKTYFTGYMMAYEFVSKDFSKIVERKEAEKKSILTTRADFQKKLGEAEKEVVEYIAKSDEKFNEYAGKVDELKNAKAQEFATWFGQTTSQFVEFDTEKNKKIKDLEDLYIEKLKLEAPAGYWRSRAKKLRREGIAWMSGLVISTGLTVFILLLLLSRFSDDEIVKVFENTGTAIKWSILLITTVSFLAFAIKSFSKLTFSSFHLMRDAEEKEQLTYVYLALVKEKKIDTTERHLIMQSLFSRADSGLLRDDSGPTMPGNIMDQVAKNK